MLGRTPEETDQQEPTHGNVDRPSPSREVPQSDAEIVGTLAAMRRLILVGVLVGCSRSEPDARVASNVSPPAPSAVVAPALSALAPAPVEPPLAWGTRPPPQGELFPWLDGVCIHMETWSLADSVAITFGNGQGGAFARSAWNGPSVGIAIAKESGLHVVAPPPDEYFDVVGLGGTSAALWATAQQGNPRMGYTDDQLFTWSAGAAEGAGKWSARTKLPKGGELSHSARTSLVQQARGAEPLFVRVVRPMEKTGTTSILAADGSVQKAPIVAGWPKPDTNSEVIVMRLGDGSVVAMHEGELRIAPSLDAPAKTLAKEPTGTLSMRASTAYLATSSKVSRVTAGGLQPLAGGTGRVLPLDQGAYMMMADGKTFALEGDTFQPRAALPEPLSTRSGTASTMAFLNGTGAVADTDGVSKVWAIGKSGAVYMFDGNTWDKLEMPAPPFAVTGKYSAERLLVLAPDDVVINARYIEKGLGWKEPEPYRALLRSKRPSETLRCEDPLGSAAETKIKSWPPRATPSCTTPFVTLFRNGWQSQFHTGGKYAGLAPIVREYAESITELEVAGSKWAGVKVESTAKGEALALAVTKKQKALRPEVVCGVPEKVIREVSVR